MTKQEERQQALANAALDTIAVRAGQQRTEQGEHSEALFLTSSYVFDDAASAAARFSGEEQGNVYSRYTNPTVANFEQRLAQMEGADDAVATASGMSAILSTMLSLLEQGDHVICSVNVFGTTTSLFNNYLAKFGVTTTFVAANNIEAWRAAFAPSTKLLFLETPSNPLSEVADIPALASLAQEHNTKLIVDNCFCTPALQLPLALGADIVIHSATKYLDGQGRCLGGAVVGRQEDMDVVRGFLRTAGPSMSAFNAWVFLKGLETLRLRMEAHSASALKIAQWLQQQDKVERVYYAGLPEHPGHALAKKQQKAFGGVVSFEVKGNKEAAWRCIDGTRVMSITANLGDAKTTIVHPATTTHGRLTDELREQSGIRDNLVRVAVGLEDVDDLITDLTRGLAAV